jgi:hypothetical protein
MLNEEIDISDKRTEADEVKNGEEWMNLLLN